MYLLLILAVAILALLALKPAWRSRLPQVAVPKEIGAQAGRWQEKSRGWFVEKRPFWKKKLSPGALLLAWATNEGLSSTAGFNDAQSADLSELRRWISGLTPAEQETFAQECAAFCKVERIRLSWLLNEPERGDLQQALSGLVLFYGLAVRERAGARPSIVLRTWQDAPLAKSNRDFGKQLYARLVDAGLIAIPAQLLLAPEKERMAHQVGAIQDLIRKDRARLLPFVAEIITPHASTVTSDPQPSIIQG